VVEVDLIVRNAGELITCRLELINDGAVAICAGRIVAVGVTKDIEREFRAEHNIDAEGALVSPAFVDPHSHLLYGGTRHIEHESKITGRSSGSGLQRGINYTVSRTREASDSALMSQAQADLDVMLSHGTTMLEAKTGYGLDRDTELRLLRLTHGLHHTVDIVTTYLGAHVLPSDYEGRREQYLDLVLDLLPEASKFAEYCDVCCDPVSFTYEECLKVAKAAQKHGMNIRVHADQTGNANGAQLAAEVHAHSADHLDYTTDQGFAAMAKSGTVGIIFPAVTLHMCEMTPKLQQGDIAPAEKPFMPQMARRAINSGCTIALSTDYNPGSCPTPSMQMVMQIAARLFRLSYAEIWNMCTINAAASLRRTKDRGSLEPGKRADIIIWKVPEHGLVINRFGVNLVDKVIASGRTVVVDGHVVSPAVKSRDFALERVI
jgi:imidazolonepropionase